MTVSPADVAWAGGVLVAALLVVMLGGRQLIAHCFDPANPAAASRAGRHELVILGLILASVTVAIPAVGTILSIALLGIFGLAIAVPARLSAGGTIALLCAACVLASRVPHWWAGNRRTRRAHAGNQ